MLSQLHGRELRLEIQGPRFDFQKGEGLLISTGSVIFTTNSHFVYHLFNLLYMGLDARKHVFGGLQIMKT